MRLGAPAGLTDEGYQRIGVCVRAYRAPGEDTPVLVIDPAIGPADIPMLCARLADLVRPERPGVLVVVCDVGAIVDPSAVTVDALARLRLTARRMGADIRLRGMQPGLLQLLSLTGLDGTIPTEPASPFELQGQAEEREQPLDIEEVGDTADPAA